jgi:hypothetical protein
LNINYSSFFITQTQLTMADHRLLEIVDNLFSDPESINEGGYLEICNLLKKNFDSNPDKLKEELDQAVLLILELKVNYSDLMDDYNDMLTRKGILLNMIVKTDTPTETKKMFENPFYHSDGGPTLLDYNTFMDKFKTRDERRMYPRVGNSFVCFPPDDYDHIFHPDGHIEPNDNYLVWNDIFLQRPSHSYDTRLNAKTYLSFMQLDSNDFYSSKWVHPTRQSYIYGGLRCAYNTKDYQEWHDLDRHMNCEDNVLRLLFG